MSESSTTRSALTIVATSAASESLSPKRISSTATVSFSLTTGTAPECQQPLEGVARVQERLAMPGVVTREQHLADRHARARRRAPRTSRSARPDPPTPRPAATACPPDASPWPSRSTPAAIAPDETSTGCQPRSFSSQIWSTSDATYSASMPAARPASVDEPTLTTIRPGITASRPPPLRLTRRYAHRRSRLR